MTDRFTRSIYLALAEGRDLSADEEHHLASCDGCRAAADRAREFERALHAELAPMAAPLPGDPLASAPRYHGRWGAAALVLGVLALSVVGGVVVSGQEPDAGRPAEPTYTVSQTTVQDGIAVTLELTADQGTHADRVWGRVTIENRGSDNVYWQSGGCGHPARIGAIPVEPWTLEWGRGWSDEVRQTLKSSSVLSATPEEFERPPIPEFTPAEWVDREGNFACTTDWKLGTLTPGATATYVAAWDHVGPYEMPVPPGAYRISGMFRYYGRGSEPPDNVDALQPEARVGATIDYEVRGSLPDYISPGEAIDAALSDDRFFQQATQTRDRWLGSRVEFGDDAWLFSVDLGEPEESLIATIDPVSGRVTDVSVVPRTEPPDG